MLLQEQHFIDALFTSAVHNNSVEINTRGQIGTVGSARVEANAVIACVELLVIEQAYNLLSEDVIHGERQDCLLR